MASAFAMIMAGGFSESLSVLTETRAEPAVPFGGKFRLVDFPLSNCVNSDIYNVAVLTQYRPRSLNDHIGVGRPWDLDRSNGGVRLLQPYRGGEYGDWQEGTADAVRRNLDYVKDQDEEHVLILAGDHIYIMDYRHMLRQHEQMDADLTVAVRRVSPHETHRFGIVSIGSGERIVDFEEKPKRSDTTLASMGIYVFKKQVLIDLLQDSDTADFGREVVPQMVASRGDVHAYRFPGYWADVGTAQSYWEANMSLLAEEPALDLYDPGWVVHTRSTERAPVRVGPNAHVDGNLLSNGAQVDGTVERSVLSPGVRVAEGATVRDSVILGNVVIESGAVIERCIIDEHVVVREGAQVGYGDDNAPNVAMSDRLNTGLTLIGSDCVIPANITIGRNVVVHPQTEEGAFGGSEIASGSSVGKSLR